MSEHSRSLHDDPQSLFGGGVSLATLTQALQSPFWRFFWGRPIGGWRGLRTGLLRTRPPRFYGGVTKDPRDPCFFFHHFGLIPKIFWCVCRRDFSVVLGSSPDTLAQASPQDGAGHWKRNYTATGESIWVPSDIENRGTPQLAAGNDHLAV